MTRLFLLFFFSMLTIASCKCSDKKVDETSTTTTATTTSSDNNASQNLQQMSKDAANQGATNVSPNEPGEEQMNKLYGTGTEARQEMARRNEMRKSGKLTAGYYPEGSERKLTQKDVQYLTPWGMEVMLNEIYARHGMTFKDDELKRHFAAQTWYHGTSANVYQNLSSQEKQNISFLINTESVKDREQGVAAN